MKRVSLIIAVLFLLMVSCTRKYVCDGSGRIIDFKLVTCEGDTIVPFLITNNVIHVKVKKGVDLTKLVPIIEHDGESIFEASSLCAYYTKNQSLDFSDFTNPITFHVISSDGKRSEWIVKIYDLPVFVIETPDGEEITSKQKRKKDCIVSEVQNDSIIPIDFAGIRGRGNSTWIDSPQKPYNIKFKEPHGLLGMNSGRYWILLANGYFDRTHLHNATAFEMARLTDFPWVQEGRFVELIINGDHKGLYYLCEKIEQGNDKIKLAESANVNLDSSMCGYLLETLHEPEEGDMYFVTDYINKTGWTLENTIFWECKFPKAENLGYNQLELIKNELNHLESLISNDDSLKTGSYRDYFDIESAIDWLLVEDAAMNKEAASSKNVFLYKSSIDGKFHVGPPWDFDAWTFGDRGMMKQSIYPYALYYRQLMKDPVFVKRLKEKWAIYKPIWEQRIPQYIDEQYTNIRRAALRNETMWTNTYKKAIDSRPWYSPRRIAHSIKHPYRSYDKLIPNMKSSFLEQLNVMDKNINSLNQ